MNLHHSIVFREKIMKSFCLGVVLLLLQANLHTSAALAYQKSAESPQVNNLKVPAITLTELEQMALKNNPTSAQAEFNIRAAEGRRVQAGLWPNPIVGYSGEEFAFRAFANKSEHFFFVEQEIPLGGKLKKSQKIAEQEKAQSTTLAEAQRRRVLNTVQMLFYQTLGAQAQVEAKSELAKITREAVNISAELLNLGQADQPD